MDKIRWINHAGFELQTDGIRLICDPWLDGLAFNRSWALISKTKFKPEDFAGVNYIWFSHEHPDHFSTFSIRSIPPEIRGGITVLFQKTKDGRVAKFCRDLGFKEVKELENWQRLALSPNVHFTVRALDDDIDSLCYIETSSHTYLNINDCVVRDLKTFHEDIRSHIGRVDVLLTQFSFANWVGNPGDIAAMRRAADEKIDQIRLQLAIYNPKILIPFASFVWFCRTDNFHLNEGANRIRDIHSLFRSEADCVVLYPGQTYFVGASHHSEEAIRLYDLDEAAHSAPLDLDEKPLGCQELDKLATELEAKMRSKNYIWMFKPLEWINYLRPIDMYLTDLEASVRYSMSRGLTWINIAREDAGIELSSNSFAQMLRYGTGYDTLYISGRFLERKPGSLSILSRNFMVARRNEAGQYFPAAFFNPAFLKKQLGLG